jgi:hypothetical protein
MKNYSDLQATNYTLDVCVELAPVGTPDVIVKVATVAGVIDTFSTAALLDPVKLTYTLDLVDLFSIEIELRNKTYTLEYETAVIVQRITVDSIDIVPVFDRLASYVNDHNHTSPTSYLGFNGKWTLTFDRPFYQWIHWHTAQGSLVDQ